MFAAVFRWAGSALRSPFFAFRSGLLLRVTSREAGVAPSVRTEHRHKVDGSLSRSSGARTRVAKLELPRLPQSQALFSHLIFAQFLAAQFNPPILLTQRPRF